MRLFCLPITRPWTSLALIAAAAACSACAPFPHFVTLSPEISGKVALAGKPLQGAAVFLGAGPQAQPCAAVLAEAVETDREGSFLLPRRTQLRWLYAPLVAPLSVSPFTVCLRRDEAVMPVYRGLTAMYEDGTLALLCEADEPGRSGPACRRER